MTYRNGTNPSTDAKAFNHTARKTKKVNVQPKIGRGGMYFQEEKMSYITRGMKHPLKKAQEFDKEKIFVHIS